MRYIIEVEYGNAHTIASEERIAKMVATGCALRVLKVIAIPQNPTEQDAAEMATRLFWAGF